MAMFLLLLAAFALFVISGCGRPQEYISPGGWEDGVRDSLNSFIAGYGSSSPGYDGSTYAVFDFDNSTAIFDASDQLAVYQLMHMAFAMSPEELKAAITLKVPSFQEDLAKFGHPGSCLDDWVTDIHRSYDYLYQKYGPFSPAGVSDPAAEQIHNEPMWLEFAAKMRAMYDIVAELVPLRDGDPWISYWFAGMTPNEVYTLAEASCKYYMPLETSAVIWQSPADIPSLAGVVSYTWYSGLSVTDSIRELLRVLSENGIDVWICSGSFADVIRAAIDCAGIHEYVTGLLAMTDCSDECGRYITEYDFENGTGWLCKKDGGWERDTLPMHAQPHRVGKTDAILNTLVKKYGRGPSAGFMDSTGDFFFCTEFSSMRLAVCLNRADRSIRNGGGLIAALAVYQCDTLGYDLEQAAAHGDTLYLLQGRDENGHRTLRQSRTSLRLGQADEMLFMNEDNMKLLRYITGSGMSTREIIEKFSRRTPAGAPENPLGAEYGFLIEYRGYHSIG